MPGPEGPTAPGASAESKSSSTPSVVETTATPITPETPKIPNGIPTETNPDDQTGIGIADNITANVSKKVGPNDLLQEISDGKTFTASQDANVFKNHQKMMGGEQSDDHNEPSIKPDENPVKFGNVDEYKKNFASVQHEDTDASTAEPNKANTNTQQNIKDQTPASPPEPDAKSNQPATEKNQDQSQTNQPPTGAPDGTLAQIHDRLDANIALNDTLTELQNVNQQLNALRASKNPDDQQKLAALELKKTELTSQYTKLSEAPVKTSDNPQAAKPLESNTANQKPITENPTPNEAKPTTEAEGLSPEQKPIKEPTPEEAAKNEVISYFSTRLARTQEELQDPNFNGQGYDFDIARCEAYIKQAQEGKFFDPVAFSGTYDGDPRNVIEKSPYEFFKGIADTTEPRAKIYEELFENDPEGLKRNLEENKKNGEEAKKIADTMEKLKPADREKENEKNEDPKSENEKQTVQADAIAAQLKNLNPDFDPNSPENQNFLKNLAENPDQMKTIGKTLDIFKENTKSLENSEDLKNLGINPSEVAKESNKAILENIIKQLTEKTEKFNQELAANPNPQKQKENEKDGILLALLKALGLMLAGGAIGVLTSAQKEMSK